MKKKNLLDAIEQWSEQVIATAQDELERPRPRPYTATGVTSPISASGNLRDSLFFTVQGTTVYFQSSASYAADVEYGNSGGADYYDIKNWIAVKGVDTSWAKYESTAAWVITRAINERGVPPLPFYEPAIEANRPDLEKNVIEAFKQDVQAELGL